MTDTIWILYFAATVVAMMLVFVSALSLSDMIREILSGLLITRYTMYRLEVSFPANTSEAEIGRQMMRLAKHTRCAVIHRTPFYTYRADTVNGFRKIESP